MDSNERRCPSGHPVPGTDPYCGVCGKPVIDEPQASTSTRFSALIGKIPVRASRRVVIGAAGTVLALLAGLLVLGRGDTLVVWITPQGNDYPCDGSTYQRLDGEYAGSTVTVIDAHQSTVGVGTVERGPVEESGHCGWKARVSGVGASDFYSVRLDLTSGFSDVLQFTRSEFEAEGWNIGIKVPYAPPSY